MKAKVTTFILLISCVSAAFGGVLRDYGAPFHLAFNEILNARAEENSTCHRHWLETARNIFKSKWALKMLDASSKIPSGILSGNIADLGAFDQCLAVDNEMPDDRITGQYCKLSLPVKNIISLPEVTENHFELKEGPKPRGAMNMNNPIPKINFAICVPSSCSESDITERLDRSKLLRDLEVKVVRCQTNEAESLTVGDWIVVGFFLAIGLLLLLCTTYDVILHYSHGKPAHLILVAFSLFSNGKKLVAVSHNPNQLPCLHGIRFISILWVIVGHTYYTAFFSPTINTADISPWLTKVSSMYILGATVSVDTFFLLAGILLSYVMLSAAKKGIKFNLLRYYIHRYIRLTPSLGAMILLHVTLLRFMGSGPNWPDVMESLQEHCNKYWWTTLLYVQNYVNPKELCIGQTWYLSVDTQLFVLSPIALVPLCKWPKQTLRVLGLVVIISMVVPFAVSWSERIPALMPFSSKVLTFGEHYYYSTYSRFGPTVVGIILGYLIFKRKENRNVNALLNNHFFSLGGWLVSVAILGLIVFQPNNMFWHEYDQTESSVYLGVHRVAWSIAVGWIIYACIQGHGGFVNAFLSHPLFQVLSRLSYSMYLIHLSFQTMKIGYLRVPIYFSDFQNMYNFWGDCMITIILSIVWTLAFESPIIILEKVIFGQAKPQIQKPKVEPDTS